MKQKDIALIIMVVAISGIVSLVLGRLLFNTPKSHQTQAEYVDAISTEFPTPSTKYFNANAIDLTQEVHIGDSTNAMPFAGH